MQQSFFATILLKNQRFLLMVAGGSGREKGLWQTMGEPVTQNMDTHRA